MYKSISLSAFLAATVEAKHSRQQARPYAGTAPWHEENREGKWFKLDYPIDYKVPNFGVDHDIIHTKKHIADQEKRLDHKWIPKRDPETKKFIVPNAANANSYSYMPSNMVQRKSFQSLTQSDPISGSAGWPVSTRKAKVDDTVFYPDPDTMELDFDMVDSVKNLKDSEVKLKRY